LSKVTNPPKNRRTRVKEFYLFKYNIQNILSLDMS
jgi:hypothetical protein